MALKFLNNIANRFLKLNLISEQDCNKITQSIAKELNQSSFCYQNEDVELELDKHFLDIDLLRNQILILNPNFSSTQLENKINYFMAQFLPKQAKLNKLLKNADNPYELLKTISLYSYYVKKDKNDKNLLWKYPSEFGDLDISINKAKPEKTIDQIKAAAKRKTNNKNKPKCVICIENLGYAADDFSDSRQNLRVNFVNLNNDKWFFQYSPYSYLNNHFVLNALEHRPMNVSNKSIENLLTFVSKNPNFFLGSNADLPIVGGSLLSHDHYQGGQDTLPIMRASTLKEYTIDNSKISILNWALNTLKISSKSEKEIYNIGCYFLNNWKLLDNDLIKNNDNNTCTLILNKVDNIYNLFLIYRNNTTSEKRPYGNFHVHQNKFNIKQENIGLMEAGGLAILPQRLEKELLDLASFAKENKIEEIKANPNLKKHYKWIKSLVKNNLKIDEKNIFDFASETFKEGLKDCKVLSDTQFAKYIDSLINDEIILKNKNGFSVSILKRGFTIKQIKLNNNKYLLEYKNKNSYYHNSILLNSFVGPVAGRIEKNVIKFDNKKLKLPLNDNGVYIHSMKYNTAFMDFNFAKIEKNEKYHLLVGIKKVFNKDLAANYNFIIKAKLFQNKNKFSLEYLIESDSIAIANPTQHFYFRFNDDHNISSYKINIDSSFKYWDLNNKSLPSKLLDSSLLKEVNTIKDIANMLGKKQQKIVNGLVDHPFVNINKKDIYLENKTSKIKLSSKIKDFVIYTHNYPSNEALNIDNNRAKNNGVCVEFQYNPISKNNQNYEQILINKKKSYKNEISFEVIK